MPDLSIKFNIPPVPDNFQGNLDKLFAWFSDNVTATIDGSSLAGRVGGAEPHEDIGIWVSEGMLYTWDADKGRYVASVGIPIGSPIPWASISAVPPAHFLLCEGQAVLREDYPDLFSVIGTQYGFNTVDDFKVPDMRGRCVIGAGQGPWKAGGLTPRFEPGTYFGTPYVRNMLNYVGSGIPTKIVSGTAPADTQASSVYQPSTVMRYIIRAK